MAKSSVPLLTSSLCFLSLFSIAFSHDYYYVQGKVYCDTCRVSFETQASEYIGGAKVRLECRDHAGGQLTHSVDGECDESGSYRLQVEGDHEEEICEVVLLKSTRDDCDERVPGRDRARVLVTENNGISSDTRFANSLGFMKKEPLPICSEVIRSLGLLPSDVMA